MGNHDAKKARAQIHNERYEWMKAEQLKYQTRKPLPKNVGAIGKVDHGEKKAAKAVNRGFSARMLMALGSMFGLVTYK